MSQMPPIGTVVYYMENGFRGNWTRATVDHHTKTRYVLSNSQQVFAESGLIVGRSIRVITPENPRYSEIARYVRNRDLLASIKRLLGNVDLNHIDTERRLSRASEALSVYIGEVVE